MTGLERPRSSAACGVEPARRCPTLDCGPAGAPFPRYRGTALRRVRTAGRESDQASSCAPTDQGSVRRKQRQHRVMTRRVGRRASDRRCDAGIDAPRMPAGPAANDDGRGRGAAARLPALCPPRGACGGHAGGLRAAACAGRSMVCLRLCGNGQSIVLDAARSTCWLTIGLVDN